MSIPVRPLAASLCAIAAAIALAACGEKTSTSGFKGEERSVAQTISDFQSDAMVGDEKKLCTNDLASIATARLKSAGGCEAVLKRQLHELDGFNVTIESVTISGATARARVKSTWSGKSRTTALSLVKEGARWKISGLG